MYLLGGDIGREEEEDLTYMDVHYLLQDDNKMTSRLLFLNAIVECLYGLYGIVEIIHDEVLRDECRSELDNLG